MLLKSLREQVLDANLELVRRGLVVYTFGNLSGIDRGQGLVAIKPSGVPYEELTPAQIVIMDLAGKIVDGNLRPSSDWPTHLELYKHFPNIGGSAHAFRIRHGMGTGGEAHPLLRDHTRRLFSRFGSSNGPAQWISDKGRI
jgi:L-ribulose-5-phosphate 4-epimerase